ncbi:MAG TPA: hypothetical protein VIM16_05880 [Mucilaginibacter sp.]|jgi:hypothetical protein
MTATAVILTSVHGKRLGIGAQGHIIINGRRVPSMDDTGAIKFLQGAPGTINATASMLAADLLTGIVTSTSAAAVAASVPTGTLLDAAAGLLIGEAFEWNLINTGPNTVTVTADTGHTLVGTMTVVTAVSAAFLSRKTAANTFVTYRLS